MSNTSLPQYAFPDQMGSLYTDPAVELERARDLRARRATEKDAAPPENADGSEKSEGARARTPREPER